MLPTTTSVTTETRMYVGELHTIAVDGFAGLERGRNYQLLVERPGNGLVLVHLPAKLMHLQPLELNEAAYARWFIMPR